MGTGRVRALKHHLCCHTHCVSCVYVQLDFFVHYESIKREINTRPIYECRYDERLRPCLKGEESTRLAYTGLLGELEHLKIETRLIDEKFASDG